MDRFIPFASPQIGEEEISEVVDLLRSGWITTGPKVRKFESEFSSFLGGEVHALAVNSATAGLHLALEALGVTVGDEVITTTHTFTATAEVIRYLGAHPVFVDISESTLCINLDLIESAITPRTKVIIPVHFGGLGVDMTKLITLARKYNLKIVEDAAHALPTTVCGQLVGSFKSDISVFSFYANKTITTGEGGMVVTRDEEIAKRIRIMRLHGISRDAFERFTSTAPSWYYEVIAPGFKYNMMDLCAAIGIHQLQKAVVFQSARQKIAERYIEEFSELPIILPPEPLGGDIHSWHLFVIQLEDVKVGDRNRFIERMFSRGVGCSVHYIPLHLHPYWRDTYYLSPEMFPVSQKVYERSVSLPIYTRMTDSDVTRVVGAVRDSIL
jgi:dTDP-4-amino-4,6-dideoxygalactose transaminase